MDRALAFSNFMMAHWAAIPACVCLFGAGQALNGQHAPNCAYEQALLRLRAAFERAHTPHTQETSDGCDGLSP
jgi:hypothetical protein